MCVRTGGHCAYPLHKALNIGGTTRISTYVYNDLEDLEKTFQVLEGLD
ncbi:MAG: aminotransferase class V-fold PLP-dependent enzyme [Patescibacteria group bacterium]|nr:aminotransferase class V-fold PLP-dependent enzyme [Patescibacteria group bacterium]